MRRLLLAAGLALAALLGASACSGNPSTSALTDAAARQLQADVLVVTKSAAAHNWSVARSELQTLRSHLATARSAGTVSVARAGSIEAAIAAVRSDLAAASTTPSTHPSTPAPTITVRTTTVRTSAPKEKPPKSKHGGR